MEQWLIPWCTCGTETVSYGATTIFSGQVQVLSWFGPKYVNSVNTWSYPVKSVWLEALLCCRINLPKRKRRDRLKELERASPRESFVEADVETASEASSEQDYSYEFAQMEVIMKTLGNNGMIRIICLLSTWFLRIAGHSCIKYVAVQFHLGFWTSSLFQLLWLNNNIFLKCHYCKKY